MHLPSVPFTLLRLLTTEFFWSLTTRDHTGAIYELALELRFLRYCRDHVYVMRKVSFITISEVIPRLEGKSNAHKEIRNVRKCIHCSIAT